jgi:anaerobic dimethyl sulfoxide reductase subunit A
MTQNNFLTKTLNDTVMTRRSFLKWSAAIGGTAALAGGVDFGLKAIEGAAAAGEEQTLTVGCYHNCGGRCILATKVKDGTIQRIVPDPTPVAEETPEVPRAIPCVRGRSQTRRVYAPDRLKYPLKASSSASVGKRRWIPSPMK